jgi:uncharacterized protein
MSSFNESRLALISLLAQKSRGEQMGRTALMKYMYLLQTLRGVPVGYNFTLYSYGPFDSDVLADLSAAEALDVVKTELELYSGGYGYKIKSDDNAEWLQKRAAKFLAKYSKDIDWVIRKFGAFTSAELELVGTVVYVDREAAGDKGKTKLEQIAKLVHEVKPHFSVEKVLYYARQLADQGVLRAAA